MDISAILIDKYPTAEWLLTGADYSGLIWLSDSPKPTEKALETAWPQVQYDRQHAQVEQARKQAYTETSDPLYFEWQRGDATEQQWRDAVQAVKTAHPYPTPPGQ